MFKIGLENRDFCKSLHFYIVKKKKKKKKKKNEPHLLACSAALGPDISQQSILKQGFQKTHFPIVLKLETFFALDLANF